MRKKDPSTGNKAVSQSEMKIRIDQWGGFVRPELRPNCNSVSFRFNHKSWLIKGNDGAWQVFNKSHTFLVHYILQVRTARPASSEGTLHQSPFNGLLADSDWVRSLLSCGDHNLQTDNENSPVCRQWWPITKKYYLRLQVQDRFSLVNWVLWVMLWYWCIGMCVELTS